MSPRVLAGFLWLTLRSAWQARGSAGFRGMRLLGDRHLTFWTATAWTDVASMKAYRGAGAHRKAMRYLADWCDEASVTRWTGPLASMADWATAYERMSAAGELSHVKAPSAQHTARAWPPPRLTPLLEFVVRPRG